MGLLKRIISPFRSRAVEGEYRPGPYALSNGTLPAGTPWNFWQHGQNVRPLKTASAMREACVSAYSQTVAMCPGSHWRSTGNGGRERITTSAISRILREPNEYETISDFLLNLTRDLYEEGNAYALALRNDRFEITSLHLMCPLQSAMMVTGDGELFYNLTGNDIVNARFGGSLTVPARDVLHVRLHKRRGQIMRGETPMMSAALDLVTNDAVLRQQVAFFSNQARASFGVTTEEKLTKDQMIDLRQRVYDVTQGENAGGVPVFSWGLKPVNISNTARDAQLTETLKMGDEHIALAFRVPQQILGIGGTPFASTESLMQSWRATGLGFALNHIEVALDRLFRLRGQPDEYVELDTDALMRSSFKEQIDALVAGTHRVMTTNEARRRMELPEVEGGDEVRVQQQDVPLSYGSNLVAPAPPPVMPVPVQPQEEADERQFPEDIVQRLNDYAGPVH